MKKIDYNEQVIKTVVREWDNCLITLSSFIFKRVTYYEVSEGDCVRDSDMELLADAEKLFDQCVNCSGSRFDLTPIN